MFGEGSISLPANELSNGWTSKEIDGNGGSITVVGEQWRFLANWNSLSSVFLATSCGRGLVSIYRRFESDRTGKGVADRDKLVVQLSDGFLCVLHVHLSSEETSKRLVMER
jgi:hypothetical protein